jgi:pimeloyl-ACP methyl ester carboxylesterase
VCVVTTRTVLVPGGRLHVIDEGDPTLPPVLLLHAGIADSRAWDGLAPLLVSAGYRAIRRDMRGYGSTETDDVRYSNRADIVAVLDAFGFGRVVLVGNSVGGQIALDTAIEYPDRIAAVVGVAAGLGGYDGEPTADEMAAMDRMDELEEAILAAGADADPASVEELIELDNRLWVDGPGQPADRVEPAIRDLVATMNREHARPGRVQGQPVPLEPRAVGRLAELRCPVLAVAGELDVTDVARTARHLETNAPDARAIIWPDVAHMIAMEQPERLAAAIVEFLAPLPRWS